MEMTQELWMAVHKEHVPEFYTQTSWHSHPSVVQGRFVQLFLTLSVSPLLQLKKKNKNSVWHMKLRGCPVQETVMVK